jgi:hypothetical protein
MPTNTLAMLRSLYVVQNTYCLRMESTHHVYRAKIRSIPSNTLTMLRSLYVVQNTYYQRMDSTPDVYHPNISLVGAIRY